MMKNQFAIGKLNQVISPIQIQNSNGSTSNQIMPFLKSNLIWPVCFNWNFTSMNLIQWGSLTLQTIMLGTKDHQRGSRYSIFEPISTRPNLYHLVMPLVPQIPISKFGLRTRNKWRQLLANRQIILFIMKLRISNTISSQLRMHLQLFWTSSMSTLLFLIRLMTTWEELSYSWKT